MLDVLVNELARVRVQTELLQERSRNLEGWLLAMEMTLEDRGIPRPATNFGRSRPLEEPPVEGAEGRACGGKPPGEGAVAVIRSPADVAGHSDVGEQVRRGGEPGRRRVTGRVRMAGTG